jgi:putative membrane protein insertion efficiency factor
LYQVVLSPIMGGRCRFHPSCSHYAIEAIELYGLMRGSWLALTRILRCHPWGGSGDDPVPRP